MEPSIDPKMQNMEKAECQELISFIMNNKTKLPDPPTSEIRKSSNFRLKILQFSSPSCFSFQFAFDEILQLENDLKNFYSAPSTDFHIRKFVINMLVVVFLHDTKNFYRAIIKNFDEVSANVVLIDYTNHDFTEVEITDIYHMENKFARISRKVAVGKISGIKPKGNNWSEEEREMAGNIIQKGKKLRGRLENVIPFQALKVYALSLFDVHGFAIKDILLKEGVGEKIEDS